MNLVMGSEGVNGVESGSAGADPMAIGIGDGKGESGGGDTAHALGAVELPIVEVGLVGASSGEDDGIPGGNPIWMSNGKPEMVP